MGGVKVAMRRFPAAAIAGPEPCHRMKAASLPVMSFTDFNRVHGPLEAPDNGRR